MTSPSILILGTDAVLAAAPATPVQLAHACLAAGWNVAVPASWGDELIAKRAIDALKNLNVPLVQCVCPSAADRLAGGTAMSGMTFTCDPPPVMTAAYVRAMSAPARVHITYAGACPAGAHPLIDVWLAPDELFDVFRGRGIALAAQPTEFDGMLTPDRRRHFSEPGGTPNAAALARAVPRATVTEPRGDDFAIDLAQLLLEPGPALVDIGPILGCACAGVIRGDTAARGRMRELEPPRAASPVVEHDRDGTPAEGFMAPVPAPAQAFGLPDVPLATTASHPEGRGITGITAGGPDPTPASGNTSRISGGTAVQIGENEEVEIRSRRSPAPPPRVIGGAIPQARTAGRQLPRAYVARRRSSPRGLRVSGVRPEVGADVPGRARPRVVIIAVALVALVAVGVLVAVLAAFGS